MRYYIKDYLKSDIDYAFKVIEKHSGIVRKDIRSKRRYRPVVDARRIAAFIFVEYYSLTYEEIGALLNRDHSTVTYLMRNHQQLISYHNTYKFLYEEVCSSMHQKKVEILNIKDPVERLKELATLCYEDRLDTKDSLELEDILYS